MGMFSKDKIKVLWFSDSPTVETGFAQVAKQILQRLNITGKYAFTIWGINYFGEGYDKKKYPYNVLPPCTKPGMDPYGFDGLKTLITSGQFDILFTLNDLQILNPLIPMVQEAKEKGSKMKWILYSPLDGNFISAKLAECMEYSEYPVCYTQFQYDKTIAVLPHIKDKLKIMYHGAEPETFHPITPENRRKYRKEYFGIDDDKTFLLINVNRNQWRKDIGRTMYGFKRFNEKYPNSRLYMHCQVRDVGGSILDQAKGIGLDLQRDIIVTPTQFNAAHGLSRSLMNTLYGCSDVLVSTTLDEGWGLCVKPDTFVRTDSGPKEIQYINKGDFVLIRQGFKKVLDTIKREHSGDLIEITVNKNSSSDPLCLTPEHPVLTKTGWKPAGELSDTDILVRAKDDFEDYAAITLDLANYENSLEWCRSEKHIWHHGSYKKNFPRYVTLNKEFSELYGIYLAEGSASKGGIVFSISQDEKELTKRIRKLCKRVLGVQTSVEDDKFSKKRWIRIYGNIYRSFFAKIAGTGARNKRIHLFKDLSAHHAAKVLKGIWWGDGSLEECGYEITTCSRGLAYDIKCLAERLRIQLSLEHNPMRDSYRLRTNTPYARRFSAIVQDNKHWVYNYTFYEDDLLEIKSLKRVAYTGLVYDLCVEDAHEFMTHQCIVHNSVTEAMAAKLPTLVPRNTSLIEIVGEKEERGWLAECGTTDSEWMIAYGYSDLVRPLVNVPSFVSKLEEIHNLKPAEKDKRLHAAYRWANEHTWAKICEQWKQIFQKASEGLK